MNYNEVLFKINSASISDILKHLESCTANFIPPLTDFVVLLDYSTKLSKHATKFEAWSENLLIGLVACYYNDLENKSGFISNVSVHEKFTGIGIARTLLSRCIEFGEAIGFKEIRLEVSSNNFKAIELYEKLNFEIQANQITRKNFIAMRRIL